MCVSARSETATPPAAVSDTSASGSIKRYYDNAGLGRQDGDAIDQLNAFMTKQAHKVWSPDNEDYKVYEMVRQGHVVFKRRSMPLLYFYWATILVGLLRTPSLLFLAGALASTYVYMELYSAVLHIVLDNPAFIKVPGLDQPVFEFLAHHILPVEIAQRRYRDICGDLNVIVGLIFAINLLLFDWMKDGRVMCVVAAGGAMAYLGQFAHRQAHMPPSKVSPFARALQDAGLLVSPHLHRAHHRTYDRGFAILGGWSEGLITTLYHHVVPSQYVWLALFAVMTVFGLAGVVKIYIPAYDAFVAFAQ
ncbi:hypothetical protein NSK_004966 [Nannochloropsis salina CCMP1776]|uniref:Lipid desaturase domain-containing protein n=1 Tax=Nannochloropsis salina CCMP1776 TaxID=1027361 RepID=A0A4D9D5K9_9STRA|nr:hypothetical protein NSK_004966 [Nannochloropsis salina CCMP1776]|eukprot:TFJ83869.1 hypothetical protein NSK_004966 [Nannochloropsis salina CCMP1776]